MNNKIVYYITTALFCVMMLATGFGYITAPMFKENFAHLGLPAWFRIELGIAKILGIIAILLPFTPKLFKQFAYSGFIITLISGFIAHIGSGDGPDKYIPALVMLLLTIYSFNYYLNNLKKVY